MYSSTEKTMLPRDAERGQLGEFFQRYVGPVVLVSEFIRLTREHGKRMILMPPIPICEPGLEPHVEAMRELADKEGGPLIDVFRYLSDQMIAGGKRIDDLVPDGYHPADEVYIMAGRYTAKEFLRTGGTCEQVRRGVAADYRR